MYGIATCTECKRSGTVRGATRSKTVDEGENDSLLWQTRYDAEKLRKAQKMQKHIWKNREYSHADDGVKQTRDASNEELILQTDQQKKGR